MKYVPRCSWFRVESWCRDAAIFYVLSFSQLVTLMWLNCISTTADETSIIWYVLALSLSCVCLLFNGLDADSVVMDVWRDFARKCANFSLITFSVSVPVYLLIIVQFSMSWRVLCVPYTLHKLWMMGSIHVYLLIIDNIFSMTWTVNMLIQSKFADVSPNK